MRKKKIVIHTNPIWLKTGLAENGRALVEYLYKTGKYDIVYYASQTNISDPMHELMPWKSYGCIPNDPNVLNEINKDQGKARSVSYGSHYIDEIIKNEKPDILFMSDDIWSFGLEDYANKKWHNKINSIYHITVDSLPVLDQAFEQAKKTKNYFTWAKFAKNEMQKFGKEYSHVSSIYGAVRTKDFNPLSKEEKNKFREKFGINKDTIIIGKLGRNQLRKEYGNLLIAFSQFKQEHPNADIKLHFHTSFSERSMGWDIEKLMAYYGIKKEDVLCTYVCKNCGAWHVKPYEGEDIDCPYCGEKKSMITANIQHGVPNEEMKYLYGLWDAGINLHTSGGQELHCVNTLLCGLPLAVTNYASGQDFCEQPFVTPILFEKRFEAGTSFMKSANSISSVKNFINKIYRMKPEKRAEIGKRGYEWALKTFSIETIGKQWEEIFDSLPFVDWNDFSFEKDKKIENFKLPINYKDLSDNDFITLLYKEILKMDEPEDGSGRKSWLNQIKNGIARENIYQYFINVAKDDNVKNKQINFVDLLDKNNARKRAIFIIKESIGDCLIMTSLFESFHKQYENTDLYVACDPKYFDIFEGNPFVYKLLPYQSFMESEMQMIGVGQKEGEQLFNYFFHSAILTQRQLQYLSIDKVAQNLNL